MNIAKRFLKSTVVFFVGNVSSKLIALLMLPLYSRMILPSSFGEYDLGVTYANLIYGTLYSYIWMGTLRFMCEENEFTAKQKVAMNGNVTFLLLSLGYVGVFCLLNLWLKIRFFPFVLALGVAFALQMQANYIVRGYGRNSLFAASGIVNSAVTALANLLFIVVLHLDYWALYLAAIIGVTVQLLFIGIGLKVKFSFDIKAISLNLVKSIVKYCAPLCFNFSAMWLLLSYNRIVLVQVLGAEQNGYYAMAAKFNTVITLVGGCFSFAWQELSFQKGYAKEGDNIFYTQACALYLKLLFWAQLIVIPFVSLFFNLVIDSSYSVSKQYVPFALLASTLGLFSAFLSDTLLAIKQSKLVSISMVFAAVVGVSTMHLLVDRIGVQAANVSMIAGHLALILTRCYFLRKSIGLNIRKNLVVYFVLSVPALALVISIYYTQNTLTNLILVAFLGVSFLLSFRKQISTILKKAD